MQDLLIADCFQCPSKIRDLTMSDKDNYRLCQRSQKDKTGARVNPGTKVAAQCLIATMGIFCACVQGQAEVEQQASAADKLPNEILKREIQIQELNQQLNLHAANPSFARARRTWLWDYANALPTEAGLIGAVVVFHGHSSDKISQTVRQRNDNGLITLEPKLNDLHNHVPDSKVANTIVPQIAGQVIGAAGSFFELSTDYNQKRRLRRLSLNYAAASSRVKILNEEISDLIDKYSLQKTADTDAHSLELAILKDIRAESVAQFKNLESQSLCNSIGRVIEDEASLGRNVVGAIGNSINIAGIMRNSKRQNGCGSILNLVAAGMVTMRPIISNAGAAVARRISFRRTGDIRVEEPSQMLQTNVERLSRTANMSADASLETRIRIYKKEVDLIATNYSFTQDETRRMKQLAVRRYRESIYGPTKVSQSIGGVVIGYRDLNNATRDNRLATADNVTYCSGQVFNILELTRERVFDEATHAKLRRAGMLPEDRIKRSLNALVDIQRELGENALAR